MLGEGRIIEAGHPAELLQAPYGSPLRSMVDELGAAAHTHFLRIAQGEVSVIDALRSEDGGAEQDQGQDEGEEPVIVSAADAEASPVLVEASPRQLQQEGGGGGGVLDERIRAIFQRFDRDRDGT